MQPETNVPFSKPLDLEPQSPTKPIFDDIMGSLDNSGTLLPSQLHSLYSMDAVNNVGVDQRIQTQAFDVDSRDVYSSLSDGTLISRFKNFIPGTNNEERLAQQQGAGEQWWNGTKKLAGKTGTAIMGGTIGTVEGLINAISKGSISAIYNSDFNKWLDDLNQKMDYRLPNYYTQQQQDMSLFRQMGTANFWADEVFSGLSFTLGMIVTEGIWAASTGGTSLIARGALGGAARWSTKTLGMKNAHQALQRHKEVGKSLINEATVKGAVTQGRESAIRAARGMEYFQRGRMLYTSAAYEGGVEARHYMKETEEQFLHNFEMSEGRKPTPQEMAAFRDGLTDTANMVMAANVGLVGGTNIAIFGRALLGTRNTGVVKNNWFNKNVLGVGYERTAGGTVKALEATTRQKITSKAYDILRPVFTEGFVEEGGQGVIAGTAEAFMLSAYDPDETVEALGLIESLHEGFAESFGTKEGQKEVLIGAIIGLFGGGFASGFRYNNSANQRKSIENLTKTYNSFTSNNVLNNIIYNNKAKAAAEMVDQAMQNGDAIGGEVGNDAALVAKIERDYSFEGVKQGVKDFEAFLYSSKEQLMTELGLSEKDADAFIKEQVGKYQEFSDEYVKNREFAEAVFGTREFAEFKNAGLARDVVVRAAANHLTIGKNADLRATETINEIKDIVRARVQNERVHKALDVSDALRKADKNAYQRYNQASKKLAVIQAQVDKIQNRLAVLNQTREMNETEAAERGRLIEQLTQLQEKVNMERATKDSAFNALNLKSVSENTITQEDLDSQDANLKSLQDAIESLEGADSILYQTVKQKLNDYARAIEYAQAYTGLAQRMINPKMRATELQNFVTKLYAKNRKLEESDSAFLLDMVDKYTGTNIAQAAVAEGVDTQQRPETDEEEVTTKPQPEKTPEQRMQEEIDSLVYDRAKKRWTSTAEVLPQEVNSRPKAKAYIKNKYQDAQVEETISEEEYNTFVNDGKVTKERLREIARKVKEGQPLSERENAIFVNKTAEINALIVDPKNALQAIRDKVKELLNNNAYTKMFRGENFNELMKSRPSEQDTNKFAKFLERISPEALDAIRRDQDFSVLEEQGFTEAEIDSFTELNQRLGEWFVLDGLTENGNSVADLLMLAEQYQTKIDTEQTKTEMDKKDFVEIKEAPTKESNRHENANPVQTPDNVKVKLKNGNYEISHLNVTSLTELIPDSVLMEKKKDGELKEVDPNRIKEEGAEFVLIKGTEQVNIRIGAHARVIINKEALDRITPDSNIKILDYGSTTNFDIYVKMGDVYVPLEGDFFTEQLNKDLAAELTPGETVNLQVDTNDAFNKELLKKIKKTKNEKSKKELMGQLHVFVTTKNGEVVGSLRAFTEGLASNEATAMLINIRNKAMRMLEEGATGKVNVNYSVPISRVFVGSPNFMVVENEDGSLSAQPQPITPEMMKEVKAVGYVKDGKISLNDKSLEDSTEKMFVGKFTEKTPIVVFNYKGRNIAFPVTLVKTTIDQSSRLNEIGEDLSTTEQISQINDILIENNINPSEFQLDPTSPITAGQNLVVLNQIAERLSTIEQFADVETWINPNFNVSLLAEQAETLVDMSNKPFNAGKVILDLKNAKETDPTDVLKAMFEGTENLKVAMEKDLSDEMAALDREWRTNPAYQNLTEGQFVELMDENEVVKNPNALQQLGHISLLEQAIKKMPKKVRDNVGAEKINEIKDKLSQYKQIKKDLSNIKGSIVAPTLKNQAKKNKPKINCN
jgi:hypothetical protein